MLVAPTEAGNGDDRRLRNSRVVTRDERMLERVAKTGAGWRLRPRANFGNARGRGHACNGPNHRSATCARKEDAEETSRERHLATPTLVFHSSIRGSSR